MTLSPQLASASLASCQRYGHDTHDLLVDWPRSSSSSVDIEEAEQTVEAIKMNAMPKTESSPHPRVSFSETSTLCVYERDETYTNAKAYSPADYDLLKYETLLDARRVKELIARAPPDSTKDSVKFLVENGAIDIADLVGIEHYVLGNCGFVVKTRKLHAKKVLLQQHEQRRHQPEDPVDVESLAKVAKESSHKSTYHARIRAAVVAAGAKA